MPAPDPLGIWYDESPTGQPFVTAEIWGSRNRPFFEGNPKHRKARAAAVLRRLRCDGWTCAECGEPVPMFRRADADYCREACRKKAARRRLSSGANLIKPNTAQREARANCATPSAGELLSQIEDSRKGQNLPNAKSAADHTFSRSDAAREARMRCAIRRI